MAKRPKRLEPEVGRISVWEDGGRIAWDHGLPWIVERYEGNGVSKTLAACSEESTARLLETALRESPHD